MNTNTPSPLIPQGSLPDGLNRSRTRLVVFTILAVHVVFVCVLLLQGCKRTTEDPLTQGEPTNNLPPIQPFDPPLALPPTPPPPLTSNFTPPPPVDIVTPPPTDLTPPTTLTAAVKDHKVVKNDSFYTLAKKYGVTMKAISEANPGVDSTRLKLGQVLKIPAPAPKNGGTATAPTGAESSEKTYTVVSNDNLGKIAKAHGVTVKALRAANNLRTDRITVGQKLKIPAKSSAAPTEARPLGDGVVPP